MRATVVVPTYRRPAELTRCLAALRAQSLHPDEVLVVVRAGDSESAAIVRRVASEWRALREVSVEREGVVAAMNGALDAATGEVFALTDDDSEPATDWLERILAVLEREPSAGGVGGRDIQAGARGERHEVGRVQWFGRVIGNHHIGVGGARDVDVLKGVCCAFRTAPLREIRFDERLRGHGAQVHWELALCLALRREGWRLIYDPAIRVQHHVAPRHDAVRGHFDATKHEDAVFNETLALVEHLRGARRIAFRLWSLLIGTGESPGLLQLPRAFLREPANALPRFVATQRARRAGLKDQSGKAVTDERRWTQMERR